MNNNNSASNIKKGGKVVKAEKGEKRIKLVIGGQKVSGRFTI